MNGQVRVAERGREMDCNRTHGYVQSAVTGPLSAVCGRQVVQSEMHGSRGFGFNPPVTRPVLAGGRVVGALQEPMGLRQAHRGTRATLLFQ